MNLVNYAKENPLLTFLIIVNIYLLYKHSSKSYEKMTDTDSINEKIRKVYQADIESIRNLASVSKKLQEDGLTIPGDLTVDGKFNYLPKGSIIAFNGPTAPSGWALCDGTNGTPDLRGRFIRMFNDKIGGFTTWGAKAVEDNKTSYPAVLGSNSRTDPKSYILKHKFGDKAGTDSSYLDIKEIPPHKHTGTGTTADDDGAHQHQVTTRNTKADWTTGEYIFTTNMKKGLGKKNLPSEKGDGAHKHTFTFTTDAAGGSDNNTRNWGHNNQPPYYVLSYIMKL